MSGPGGEPGIKSEFGRMFSGIGSGVGTVMATTGPASSGILRTAFNQSPLKREESGDSMTSRLDIDSRETPTPGASSRGGRRGRKSKNDDKTDGDSVDGRSTPGGSVRGVKRSRHGHHHHHHHPHGHQ
jgi:hypothetical protein